MQRQDLSLCKHLGSASDSAILPEMREDERSVLPEGYVGRILHAKNA